MVLQSILHKSRNKIIVVCIFYLTGESALLYDSFIEGEKRQKTSLRSATVERNSSTKGRAMAKNVKEIMGALDKILNATVWVNEERHIVSLADELAIGEHGQVRSIEDLPRAALMGAYVSLQIRADDFEIPAESLETADLAAAVKKKIFIEAKKILSATDADLRKAA